MSGLGAGAEHERALDLFGTRVRLLVGAPLSPALPSPAAIALQLEGFLRVLEARLTRFRPDSELSRLNRSRAEEEVVSSILLAAAQSAVWVADRSGGLVDPTLVSEIEAAGYARSRRGVAPASLEAALEAAPPPRPARPSPDARWRSIGIDAARSLVRRPPGLRIDSGGFGKGLAADLVAERLAGYASYAVDLGGDVRIGGDRTGPRSVRIPHPLSGGTAGELWLRHGAVATSGIATRLWRAGEGFSHHLLDPSSGRPAWTGVVQATALAPNALEAEMAAKIAYLTGPEEGARVLAERGGVLVLDCGEVLAFEPPAGRSLPVAGAVA